MGLCVFLSNTEWQFLGEHYVIRKNLQKIGSFKLPLLIPFFLSGLVEPVPDEESSPLEMVTSALNFILLIAFVTSLWLLFRFNYWGKVIFIINFVAGIPLLLFMPPDVHPTSPLFHTLNWAGGALDGAILVMLFFTDVKDKFQRTPKVDD